MDLAPLFQLAFHATDVVDATQAIEQARARFSAEAKLDGFSYEVVVPGEPDRDWLAERLLKPLVYFCESRGSPIPACPGVFVSLFAGRRLYCIVAAEVIAWASRELGVDVAGLRMQYGLHEQDTTLR